MSPGSKAAGIAAMALMFGPARSAAPEVLVAGVAPTSADAAVDAWLACRKVQPPPKDCAARRSAAVEVLVRDFHVLGSRANFAPLPTLLKALGGPEPELRAAAADGIGMIGPRATETAALAAAFDDPVPAVRLSAQVALGASADEAAKALSTRARHPERWKSFEPERAPDLSRLALPVYTGATPLRFAFDLPTGTAQLVTADPVEKVLAFYAAKSKRPPLSLHEFAGAFGEPSAEEESPEEEEEEEEESDEESPADESGDNMPSEADMAKAMAMMDEMYKQLDAGKSMDEASKGAAEAMRGAETSAESAAASYADEQIYGAPKVVVLEESDFAGTKKPIRYAVVYRDKCFGKTGIALHGPPVF